MKEEYRNYVRSLNDIEINDLICELKYQLKTKRFEALIAKTNLDKDIKEIKNKLLMVIYEQTRRGEEKNEKYQRR